MRSGRRPRKQAAAAPRSLLLLTPTVRAGHSTAAIGTESTGGMHTDSQLSFGCAASRGRDHAAADHPPDRSGHSGATRLRPGSQRAGGLRQSAGIVAHAARRSAGPPHRRAGRAPLLATVPATTVPLRCSSGPGLCTVFLCVPLTPPLRSPLLRLPQPTRRSQHSHSGADAPRAAEAWLTSGVVRVLGPHSSANDSTDSQPPATTAE